MSELTTYEVDEGVAVFRLDRPDARNAINTQMLEELLAHLGNRSRRTTRFARSSSPPPTTSACPPARTSARSSTRTGEVRRMQLFADLYDELTGVPEADGRRLPRRLRRRRRRDRGRLRPPGRRLEPAPALPRRRARRPGRPRPPGHALRPLGREVPAPDLEGDRGRRGAPLGPRPQGRARRPHRERRDRARDRVRGPPARGGRPAEVDAPRVGRRRRALARRGRGPGRVAALRPGPSVAQLTQSRGSAPSSASLHQFDAEGARLASCVRDIAAVAGACLRG